MASTFAVLLLFVQACLIQNVYTQCNYGSYGAEVNHNPGLGYGAAAIAPTATPFTSPSLPASRYLGNAGVGTAGTTSFGGAGDGNVAVAGELSVTGNAGVIGQVPVLGAVSFGGNVPAAGTIVITGRCSCGCGY